MVVVGVTHKHSFKGAAAARAEKKKHEHYNSHKRKCRDEENTDSRLDVELIPLALEATGAVGREVKELGKGLNHAYETRAGATDKQRIGSGGGSVQRCMGVPDLEHPPKRHS